MYMKKIFFLFLILTSIIFSEEVNIYFFWGKGCSHCEKEKKFLKKIEQQYSFVKIKKFEVWHDKENKELFQKVEKALNSCTIKFFIDWLC